MKGVWSVECVPGCHCCRFQYILPLIQVINFAGRSETPAAKSRSIVHIFAVLAGSSRSRPKHAGGDKCCTNVNIVYILSRTEVKGWILLIIARQKYRTDQIINQRKSRSLKIQAKYTGVDIVHNIFSCPCLACLRIISSSSLTWHQPTIFKKWLSVNTTFEFHFL